MRKFLFWSRHLIQRFVINHQRQTLKAQLVERAVEYANSPSAMKLGLLLNKCSGYDTKQSDGEAPVLTV